MHQPDGCRWPMWPDDERPTYGQHRFCAAPRVIGRSYCWHHLALAYLAPGQQQPPDPRSLALPASRRWAA